MEASRPILIVIHGNGRGRARSFLPLLFDEILARPELKRRIRLHGTGMPPPSLDGFGAVVFFLSDPLAEYPACQAEALGISAAARKLGIRVVNPPEALNNTIKSRQSAIWRKAGLPCAAAEPAADAVAMRAVLDRVEYPIVLRFDPGHRQDGIFVCPSEAVALEFLPKVRFPAVALRFVDTRESWRRLQPQNVMARYFHKKRSMVFPNAVINNHIFFSSLPIVGSKTSTFTAAVQGKPPPDLDEMLETDIAYSLGPPEQPELMQAAVRALGLDIAALDYSTLADGRIVLWEANPSFALQHITQAPLHKERRLAERNPRYMQAMIDYLAQLAGLAEPVA